MCKRGKPSYYVRLHLDASDVQAVLEWINTGRAYEPLFEAGLPLQTLTYIMRKPKKAARVAGTIPWGSKGLGLRDRLYA